jgi:triosephosphate isomerase
MNKTISEGQAFIASIKEAVEGTDVQVMLYVPYTLLETMKKACENTAIVIGAQNMHYEDKGAFTGEISPLMLKDIGINHTLIGHSERRMYFGETNEIVSQKLHAAMKHGFHATLCVGENLDEREKGIEQSVVRSQIEKAFDGIDADMMQQINIAYEPIWAIGTGKTASSEDANEMIAFIRTLISKKFGDQVSEELRILYGGSVKPDNVEELMQRDDIDGGLVGGASLMPELFIQLVDF